MYIEGLLCSLHTSHAASSVNTMIDKIHSFFPQRAFDLVKVIKCLIDVWVDEQIVKKLKKPSQQSEPP